MEEHWGKITPPRYRTKFVIAPWVSAIILGGGILIFYLVSLNFNALPAPLMRLDEANHPDTFIAERASDILRRFNEIGPKVVGHRANEVEATQFLENELDDILKSLNTVHRLEFSRTTHSGSFEVNYKTQGMIEWYQNIQNIQFRLSRADGNYSGSTLLVNSHFDTYPFSPGVNDAGVMVAVMLETLRVLVQSETPYRHDIVFLFNGAEEAGLKGSHAFITQHPWRHNITALINLDSTGAGGKEILFQAGPNSPFLAKMYANHVKHPYASAMAEELFQMNVIPADTDFRIFRDYGGIKGLDFAHIYNGYVYHTKYDTLDQIPLGTYQHTGDNVVSLTKAMANSEELDPGVEHSENESVFFDYVSWFTISYDRIVAVIVNITLGLYVLKFIPLTVRKICEESQYSFAVGLKELIYMVLVQAGSAIIGLVLSVLMATIYDACGRSMSYFSNQWLVFGLFYLPFIVGLSIGPMVYFRVDTNKTMDQHYLLQMWMHANALLLTLVLFLLTFFGVRSAFVIVIPIIFYAATMTLNLLSGFYKRVNLWLPIMTLGQLFPFIFFCHLSLLAMTTFIPMQGRTGSTSNPDLMISVFGFLMAWMMTGFITPLMGFFKRDIWVWSGLLALIVATVVMIATPLGFPYTAEVSPQRHWVFHTQRNFFDLNGNLESSESGYLLLPNDRHSHPSYLEMDIMTKAEPVAGRCEDAVYCGMPMYRPRNLLQVNESYWIPAEAPVLSPGVTIRQVLNGQPENRMMFELDGPSARLLYLSPMPGVTIDRWSFFDKVTDTELDFQGRKTYFIMYSAGTPAPATFWLDLSTSGDGLSRKKIDVGLIGHYTHFDYEKTPGFQQLIDSYPDWCHVTAWTASFNGYQF